MADPVIQPGPYALGHSQQELDRLVFQGRFIGDLTAHVLRLAGLGSGMRVLDVGCGAGDVSFLAASLVGPDGFVFGVDKSPEAVAMARERAQQSRLRTCSSRFQTLRKYRSRSPSMRSSVASF